MKIKTIVSRARAVLPFADKAGDEALLLLGSGRSGTTWLSELILQKGTRFIFEPFKPDNSFLSEKFFHRQYINPLDDRTLHAKDIQKILTGDLRSRWTDQYNNQFFYDKRLIKAIRGNLLAGWVLRHYLEAKVAYIIRDPFAVCASQARGAWPADPKRYLEQTHLIDAELSQFLDLIDIAEGNFQKNILHWTIENYIPLKQVRELTTAEASRFKIFEYDILRNDMNALEEFLIFCGVENLQSALSKVKNPSRVTRAGKVNSSAEAWRNLSQADIDFAKTCLNRAHLMPYVHVGVWDDE